MRHTVTSRHRLSRRTKGVFVGALAAGSIALVTLGFASTGALASNTTPTSAKSLAAPLVHNAHHAKVHRRRDRGFVGLVTGVTSTVLTVQTRTGVTRSVDLSPSTRYLEGVNTIGQSALRAGEFVRIKTHLSSATVVRVLEAKVTGMITNVSGGSVTIANDRGMTRTLVTSSTTAYREAGSTVTAAALRIGELIAARGVPDSDGAVLNAVAIVIARGHFSGTVTAIDGSVVTLRLAGGTTATVNVTASTHYRDAGATTSQSALVDGQRVVVIGTITGTNTMTAEVVIIRKAVQAQSGSSSVTPLAIA
ncbi:DUF5666 domain-containing protein [Ferrimicrobium sp.]|uniref:DUF5666 domain-containing protein n=1 Tax=Ferrimicrobium sp. TaxID=2926050 RepID=UPI00261C938C|nr:DUF5666 domain-containing protein [Ferrimicrobium sp.]